MKMIGNNDECIKQYIILSNVRDITNFTIRCLQTDVSSYVECTTSAIKTQLSIKI